MTEARLYQGKLVLDRNGWKKDFPMCFTLVLSEEADLNQLENAVIVCAKSFTSAMIDEEDVDEV